MENHKSSTIKENLTIFDVITRKINQLPQAEWNLPEQGSAYVGFNAALCGLIANSLFQRILNMAQALIAADLPMAVIPFLTTNTAYKIWILYTTGILHTALHFFPLNNAIYAMI
uniref:Transmembrane protein 126A n=1 Tax=Piliocolobus tephrosceles TaxID=591936 RepID=A0A8C9IZG5_9PRIM